MIGARPGARIQRIAVAQGDRVQAGAVLAILEGHDQAEAQLAVALAQKARAEHHRAVKKQQLALEREQADKLQAARLQMAPRVLAARQRWSEIAGLFKQLAEDKTLPPRDRLEILLKNHDAEVQNLRGEQELKAIEIAQQIVPRQRKLEDEELEGKGPDQDLLDRQVDLARSGIRAAEVRAPRAGEVLDLMAHEGEVSSGPLLLFGDTAAMAAIAEVFQADAPRVRVGDPATVQVLGQTVAGKVTAVGGVVARNQLTSLDPRALQDRRVVKVTVQLDDPAPARRLVNMEVDVAIDVGAGEAPGAASPPTTGP
jgi:HlyD family secretion protein